MKNIDINNHYMINPAYKFRSDIKRVVLTNNNSLYCNNYDHLCDDHTTNFAMIMHPMVAKLFSFFDGTRTFKDIASELSETLSLPVQEVIETFSQYIYNPEKVNYRLSDKYYAPIPKNFIIEKNDLPARKLLSDADIDKIISEGVDIDTMRYYIPNEIMLMLTNKCMTNCVYCYADTKHQVKNHLSMERIKELITEAHTIGCRDFGISGGDIFTYKRWPEIIDFLHQHEFNPYISTKIPITEKEIAQLKELGISKIQISLDSTDPHTLQKLLGVDLQYFDKMKNTFETLRRYGIQFMVKSVITNINDDIESVKKLVDFLLQYDNLYTLSLAPGESSLYKPFTYNSTKEKLAIIEKYVKDLGIPKVSTQSYMVPIDDLPFEEKMKKHRSRSTCSGNLLSFYIMPDGHATICEQTYWHPFFHLGDMTTQSIMEMWNGEKALALWNIKQSEIRAESPCSKCDEFDACRRGAGSCWRMAIQAFGMENYDYPYPQCPYAPPATHPFYIDKTATPEYIANLKNNL